MDKPKTTWMVVLSILLILGSFLPIQTIAETLRSPESYTFSHMALLDAENQKLPTEISGSDTLRLSFDLAIEKNTSVSLSLPENSQTKDQHIYQAGELSIRVEDHQLQIVNDKDHEVSLEDLLLDFQLAKEVRAETAISLDFFEEVSFPLKIRPPNRSTTLSSLGGVTPFSGLDKTSTVNDMLLKDIYIIRSGNTKEYIVKDGVPQVPQPTVKVGDGVYFDYRFTVPSEANLKKDDYIIVDLPEEHFNFSTLSNKGPFYESGSNTKIGEIELIDVGGDKKLKIVFNENVEQKWNGLDDCFLTAYGTAGRETTDGEVGQSETGRYPIVIDPKPDEGNPGNPIGNLETITKNGGTYANSNAVYWTISLMMDSYKKALNGETPDFYQNVILEDQFDESLSNISVSMYMNIYTVTDDGKMAKDPIGQVQFIGPSGSNTLTPLQTLVQGAAESSADFEQRIRANLYPCYGITKENKLIANFRNLPNLTGSRSEGLLLFGNGTLSAKERIWKVIDDTVLAGRITAERGEKTKEAYERYFSHDNGGQYDNYPFGFNVRINAETSLGEGSVIENKAVVSWENNSEGKEGESNKITINNWGGGATRVPPTTFRLKKMDNDTKEILKNVEFELKKETSPGSGTYTTIANGIKKTDGSGVLLYENLTNGKYCLIEKNNPDPKYKEKLEIVPPDGIGEEGKYYFTIDRSAKEGIAVSAYNFLAVGKIKLIKEDAETDEKLNDAVFTLRNKDGTDVVSPNVSLETGKNYLYQYNDTTKTYTIVEDTPTSGTAGEITIEDLPLGEYYFQEERAPDGYTYDDDGKSSGAILSTDGQTVSVTRKNRKKIGQLDLIKTGPDGTKLDGAEFELYSVKGASNETKLGGTFITGKNYHYQYNRTAQAYEFIESNGIEGELHITGLPLGKYYLKETKAPDGFKITGNGKTAVKEITADGVTITFEMINELAEGDVTLIKKDATNDKNLKGAKFKVATDALGTIFFAPEELEVGDGTNPTGSYKAIKNGANWTFQLVSTVTPIGKLIIEGLPEGDYYFIETKAPDGYVQLSAAHKFTITAGQTAAENLVTIQNHPKGTLPKTGGTGKHLILGVGTLATMLVVGYFLSEQVRRKREGDRG
ncbi:hypothetical protein NRIC_32390 [Enterococcus florum]|uniref:SpaA-like prealbumin fold domain-containing protein n=1 Tax=Enterococcus florum TaxID=2480627 RepID=A0A4P5PGD1_9ENTE|nr:SpaA isopeptide-forming pilin-related protein [Enterococcus florum]GCF95348.1 hypothetical protein NRIC_32390 [Enterococcus florum]